MTPSIGVDGPASDALLAVGRFFTRWDETPDHRAAFSIFLYDMRRPGVAAALEKAWRAATD